MIRRDVYSVKVYDESTGDWCHQVMTQDLATARHFLAFSRTGRQRAKLVHPADWVVKWWLAYNGQFK